jgi:hypothetical protein
MELGKHEKTVKFKMGLTGLEPVTLRLSSACSNQLSYRPAKIRISETGNRRDRTKHALLFLQSEIRFPK